MTATPPPQSESICIHAACRCEVDPKQNYCGDYCRDEPQTGMEPQSMSCRCGHDACSSPEDPAIHT